MTQSSCSFCLELKTQNCCWCLHMRVTNLHVSILSKCLLPIFLCGSFGWEGHTEMSCKYFSRLHHIIVVLCQVLLSSTRNLDFWPNSSKHLLCPLMLEGPISSVYHLLLLLPPHYFGPTFCQRPFLFGSKRNIQESLLNIGIMFCFWFHLNLKLLRVTYFVWCQALRNKTATFDNLKLAKKQILLMSP